MVALFLDAVLPIAAAGLSVAIILFAPATH